MSHDLHPGEPANKTTIALVRHGETDWNIRQIIQGQSDIPLNATGLVQAERAADWLAMNGKWDCIYTSRLLRARKTAEVIGNRLNLRPIVKESLAERNFGVLEGLSPMERERLYPRRMEDESSVPGLEIRRDFKERVLKAFTAIFDKEKGRGIIIVSHGGWINQLLSHLSNGTVGSGITTLKNGGIILIARTYDNRWDLSEIGF